ncbi:hypothetical protein IAU59_007017 [Kwoniella sp. CBS 9459]
MTVRIPLLSNAHEGEASPSHNFAKTSSSRLEDLRDVVSVIKTAKNLVVISGAGVSTAANIPDFRSAKGLFKEGAGDDGAAAATTMRRKDKGKGRARSEPDIKDLFHVKCLTQHHTLAAHNALISSLASRALVADPTPFHIYLSSLSMSGKLLRCYTQNIDDLESKVGLKVGMPLPKSKTKSPRKRNGASTSVKSNGQDQSEVSSESRSRSTTGETGFQTDLLDPQLLQPVGSSTSITEPTVIPLHGLLSTLHCTLCHTLVPLASHIPLPPDAIPCPTCQLDRTIRSALSERPRKSGQLRPSVVLYGEEHPQGELIGQAVERDLKSVDALLVVGTSLSVPGVKRIVKEMSKVIHSKLAKKRGKKVGGSVVYVNDEPPAKPAEWKGVFDYFVQGDIQEFIVKHLDTVEPNQATLIEPSTPKKGTAPRTKKDASEVVFPPTPESMERPGPIRTSTPKKRKAEEDAAGVDPSLVTPTKARKTNKRSQKDNGNPGKRDEGVPPTPDSPARARFENELFNEDRDVDDEDEEEEEDVEDRDRQGTPTPLPFDI